MTEIFTNKYKRSGVIAAIIYMIVVVMMLLILGLKVPDPPLEEETVEIEIPIKTSGGSSRGAPTDQKTNNKNTAQPTKDIATQEEESDYVPSSEGETTTENTEPEQQVDESMTMNSGGSGSADSGSGTGQLGSGDGEGIGNFSGPNEGSSGRNMLVGPSDDELDMDKRGTVYLELIVNKDGEVLSMEYYGQKSTTQDPALIKKAKDMCRRVKFESSNNTTTEVIGPFKFVPN